MVVVCHFTQYQNLEKKELEIKHIIFQQRQNEQPVVKVMP
jgi:hypothetical protein